MSDNMEEFIEILVGDKFELSADQKKWLNQNRKIIIPCRWAGKYWYYRRLMKHE